jgi:hypothetical protein
MTIVAHIKKLCTSKQNRASVGSGQLPFSFRALQQEVLEYASLVEFAMRANGNKLHDIRVYFLVDRSDIAGNVDAPAPSPLTGKRVVAQAIVHRVGHKQLDLSTCLLLRSRRQFSELLLETP